MIVVTLHLERPWYDQIYVIIVIHTYLLKEQTWVADAAANKTNKKNN